MSLMDIRPLEGAAPPQDLPLPPILAAVNVDFDKTVFVQMAIFAILIAVLKPVLFDPMLRLFALREERTDGARKNAREMQERAAEILSNYDAEVAKVRAEAGLAREELRKETARLEAQILAEAHSRTEVITTEGRARVAREMQEFQTQLASHSAAVEDELVAVVLGRKAAQ